MRVADKLKNAGSPMSNSEKLSLNMKEPSQYCLLGYSKGGTVMQEGNVPWLHTQAHKTTSYVQKLSSYNKTYGSIGTAIVLLTWLYFTGFVILVGGGSTLRSSMPHRKGKRREKR
jgi:hypothetical protein